MIRFDFLDTINEQLAAYRGTGQGAILFDGRDPSNYNDYEWDRTVKMLQEADPTGLSIALLISAKIDATIAGSQVKLARVLEEPGFLDEIKEIHRIRKSLDDVLLGPQNAFMAQVESLITKVSPDFAKPTKREIAVSMRDAIYAVKTGMKMAWVQCDAEHRNVPIGLHSKIVSSKNLASFVEALKSELPIGVHLAKIGRSATAIGFKQPGRIAYLSSMQIDTYSGRMSETKTRDGHMRDNLDIDGVDLRYPQWGTIFGHGKENQVYEAPEVDQLSRDRMIWLAMMVELTNQEMSRISPSSIQLTESGKMAISHDAMVRSKLPVPYVPSWTLQMPTQDEVFESLGFTDWEKNFLKPLMEGVKEGDFMPIGDQNLWLRFDTKALERALESHEAGYDYFKNRDLTENACAVTSISESIAGTQDEVQAVILEIYQRNMATWLMKLGNRQFKKLWEADSVWFKKRLTKNAERALNQDCSSVVAEPRTMGAATIWEQSSKHSGFKALCWFDKKTMADVVGVLTPKTSKDLVAILGLKNESGLPEHLRGWSRKQGWATSSFVSGQGPCTERWIFGDRAETGIRGSHVFYVGHVHFWRHSHPAGARSA